MTAPAEDPRGGVEMRDPSLPCPVCGASGTQHCTTVSGRDHRRRNFPAPPRKPRPPAAGRGDTDSGGEHSTDLTPGVVWTDAQLSVVRDLTARAVRAEAAVSRVEALVHEWEKARDHHEAPILEAARELRAALDGT